MKRRKLNSKNPRYLPKEKKKKQKKVLMKETKLFKMYFNYEI